MRSTLVACGIAAGTGLLLALAMAPAMAGTPTAVAQTASCGATAHIDAQWGTGTTGGQIVTVTVTNTSATAGTGWAVTWPLASGQRIASAWNATVTTTGTTATAVNTTYNGALAPGASTTFGMQLAGTGPVPAMTCTNGQPGGADVTVTEADSQTTVGLQVGQTLQVSLGADYRPVTASGTALTPLSSTGGYPTGQPLTALYRAATAGTVDLTSQTDYACLHTSPPCALPVKLWTVHVVVTGASPSTSGRTVTVTTADNRTSVSLRPGDTLVVSLPAAYVPPTVTPAGILTAGTVTGGYPTGLPLVASYVATAQGQVDISTITDAPCLHAATPCPSPQIPWTVHVTVAS